MLIFLKIAFKILSYWLYTSATHQDIKNYFCRYKHIKSIIDAMQIFNRFTHVKQTNIL